MADMAALTFKEVPYKNVGRVLIFFPEATELISGYTTESKSHGQTYGIPIQPKKHSHYL